jgi:type IV secretion system protein TrbE
MTNDWLSRLLPWGYLGPDGVVRLRAGGTMLAREISGPSAESTSDAELESQAARISKAIAHFGTGDFLHFIVHRVAATEYPERQFPSPAAKLIDDERRQQFRNGRYFLIKPRVFISNQDEKMAESTARGIFFSSRISESRELQHRRFLQRIRNFDDSVSSVLHPRPMSSAAIFRDLLLCVTGWDFPGIEPLGRAPLHHVLSQQDLIGGQEPEIGNLFLRPISITTYPTESTPQMLSVVLKDPGRLMLSVRYICLDQVDALAQLQLERNHWVRENAGGFGDILAKIVNMPRRQTWNEDGEKTIADVDAAIAACNGGMPFGFLTVTAIVIDESDELAYSRCRQIIKDLNTIGCGARIENTNASPAVLSAWPGEGTWNLEPQTPPTTCWRRSGAHSAGRLLAGNADHRFEFLR